jgi:hypothetical protein
MLDFVKRTQGFNILLLSKFEERFEVFDYAPFNEQNDIN